jgi:hypothetical protein
MGEWEVRKSTIGSKSKSAKVCDRLSDHITHENYIVVEIFIVIVLY